MGEGPEVKSLPQQRYRLLHAGPSSLGQRLLSRTQVSQLSACHPRFLPTIGYFGASERLSGLGVVYVT